MGREDQKLNLGEIAKERARERAEQLRSRDREEIQRTIKALENFRIKFREEILFKQKEIDELKLALDQRKKLIGNAPQTLTGGQLATLLDEVDKIGQKIESLEKELSQAWQRLNYSHPRLSLKILDKLPNGAEVTSLIKKLGSPEIIKQLFSAEPLKLFLEIWEIENNLRKLIPRK